MDENELREQGTADVAGAGNAADAASILPETFFLDALSRAPLAVEYGITHALAAAYPHKARLESDVPGMLDVAGYAEAGHCTLMKLASPLPQAMTYWNTTELQVLQGAPFVIGESGAPEAQKKADAEQPDPATLAAQTSDRIALACLRVHWRNADLDLMMLTRSDGPGPNHCWVIADTEVVARAFLAAVSRWTMELRGEVLVFENGNWHKDEHLFAAIQGTSFDSLILRGRLKDEIREDVHRFFAARETYEEYGIPWKRGILFVGPPGNGKTLTVKALVNSLSIPCLYVKNFRAPHGVDEMSIRMVFARARLMAPCVLVLEDLDAQLTHENRSFFLNELDGFALNRGILTLATTNHPERLDPAILDRPSRFDRKYPFDLPEPPERRAYLALWNAALKPALRLTEQGISAIADQTEGFSFAYLKELGLSAMMAWIAAPEHPPMDDVMTAQVATLREQMISAPPEPEPDAAQMTQMQGQPGGFHLYGPLHPQGGMRMGRGRLMGR